MNKRRTIRGGSAYGTSMQWLRTYIDDDNDTYTINFMHSTYGESIRIADTIF